MSRRNAASRQPSAAQKRAMAAVRFAALHKGHICEKSAAASIFRKICSFGAIISMHSISISCRCSVFFSSAFSLPPLLYQKRPLFTARTVENLLENSRGSELSRAFNRARLRVRRARRKAAENLIFQSKNRFLAVFAPGNLKEFSKNWQRAVAGALALPSSGASKTF